MRTGISHCDDCENHSEHLEHFLAPVERALVHVEGRAIVSSGTREKAELDVFRLHEHGLWATLEQDP